MEFEQLIKRLDWLDEEQRKNKAVIDESREKIKSLESENKTLRKKVKELATAIAGMDTMAGRVEEFDTALTRHRKEINKVIDDLDKKQGSSATEIEKRFQVEIDAVIKPLSEIKKIQDAIADVRREVSGLGEEEVRRNKVIGAVQTRMESVIHSADDVLLTVRASDENRRQDIKKITDLQGEIVALRKRVEETREKNEIVSDNVRRFDIRLGEILASELERKQSQTAFIESVNLRQLERDRDWKDWKIQIESLGKEAETIDAQLQNWESAQRAVKRAQETYEEITAKFERRINEITEIQRLSEDRYRQEWVTFKADDQKRWTSFTLGQDETRKDFQTELSKMGERITSVEDLAQTLQDILQQSRDADEQMLQGILAQIHELLSAYERIKGAA